MRRSLLPDAANPSAAVDAIQVEVERPSATLLRFRYLVHGRIGDIFLPSPAPPMRADNLWRTTCFEAFVRPSDLTAYRELNFSPSRQWAAYDFTAYRAGMVQAPLPAPPLIACEILPDRLTLDVTISLDLPHDPYRLGLSAVIDEANGKSYWALHHRGGAPDFHHPACFAADLPPAPAP